MDPSLVIEIFGYIGSAFVVVAMLMSSIVKLRIINTIGCVISAIYSIICGAIPLAAMNICLIIINVYNLIKLKKTTKAYELVSSASDDALTSYFLTKHREDIGMCFPGYDDSSAAGKKAYIVCCDGNTAGVLLGEEKDGVFEVLLDYSSPVYRDCSVGKFLYSKLGEENINTLRFAQKLSDIHEAYLKKMGFVQDNGVYVKNL